MEKVTVREFQKNLKKYLDMLKAGELVEVRGIILEGFPVEKTYIEKRLRPWSGCNINGVYLIQCNEFFKIGVGNPINYRLSSIQVCTPYDIKVVKLWEQDNGFEFESELHIKFDSKRIRGEWFQLDAEDLKSIGVTEGEYDATLLVEKPDRIYALEQLKQTVRNIEQGKSEPLPISSQDQPYIRTDGKLCECCRKGTEALYEVWEDGEERIVCELCLKNRHGKMWKQFASSKIEDDEVAKVVPSLQNVPELRPTSSSPKFSAPLWKQPKKKKVDSRK